MLTMAIVAGASGIASAETAAQGYPPVDISKLVVTEMPAGTPQTTAAALDPGYVEKEYLVRGEASTYEGKLGGSVEVTQTNVPYATRVLVRYPTDRKKFSGRVVVEPFNTSSGGKDLDAVARGIRGRVEAPGARQSVEEGAGDRRGQPGHHRKCIIAP